MLHIVLTILALGATQGGDLESEIGQLENLNRRHLLKAAQAVRLSEIYFLTSRCPDVAKIAKSRPASEHSEETKTLNCACGNACDGHSELARLARFRADLGISGKTPKWPKWNDTRLQSDYHRVEHMPEARYWALKFLRNSPAAFRDPGLRATRDELEKSLESLEVKP